MRVETLPFAAEHVPAATGLLARGTGGTAVPRRCCPRTSRTWPSASPRSLQRGRPRGANTWVQSAGQALADDEDAEVVRDLYAVAAQRRADEGRTHGALRPDARG